VKLGAGTSADGRTCTTPSSGKEAAAILDCRVDLFVPVMGPSDRRGHGCTDALRTVCIRAYTG
jgi:hypothetical protein